MADQIRLRPNTIPSWANDLLINDPGETWDATATKVDPGSGKKDDGWLPDEQPPAQHENWKKHEAGLWTQYQANMQVQNWDRPTAPFSGATVNDCTCITYDNAIPATGLWLVGGNAELVDQSEDHVRWSATHVQVPGNDLTCACSKDPMDAPITAGFFSVFGCIASNFVGELSGAAVWTAGALGVATDRSASCLWADGHQLFIIAGHDTAGAVSPFAYTAPAVTPLVWTRQVALAKNLSFVSVDIAHDPVTPLTVMIGDQANGDVYWSADAITWNTISPGINNMRAIAYNPEQGLWMITNANGEIWTSGNGTAWALLTTPGFIPRAKCLRGRGGLWLVVDETSDRIYYSTDNGLTWRALGFEFDPGVSNIGVPVDLHYSENKDQWAVLMEGNLGGQGQLRLSLSCGTVLQTITAGGIIQSTPQVT